MMKAGLPVLTTLGSEITQVIKEKELGYIFKINDLQKFRELLLTLSNEKKENLITVGKKGKLFVEANWKYENILEGFMKWVHTPEFSPDRKKSRNLREERNYKKILEFLKSVKDPSEFKKIFSRKFRAFIDG